MAAKTCTDSLKTTTKILISGWKGKRNDQRTHLAHLWMDRRSPANAGCVRLLVESGEVMRALLCNPQQAHVVFSNFFQQLKPLLMSGHQYAIEVKEKTRSTEQNARMWAMLTDVSRQVEWYGKKLTPEEWKDVFSAAHKKHKVVPGIDGGFVVVGASTSKMSIREMGELMELIEAFGAQQGVRFTAPEYEVAE